MKKLLAFLLLAIPFISTGQSLNEKLTPKPKKAPGFICTKGHCAIITYYNNDTTNLHIAFVSLHGQDFIGWRPPCLSCSVLEQDRAAGEALEAHIKHRFPDAKTGFE
jgi:hypothetical protein